MAGSEGRYGGRFLGGTPAMVQRHPHGTQAGHREVQQQMVRGVAQGASHALPGLHALCLQPLHQGLRARPHRGVGVQALRRIHSHLVRQPGCVVAQQPRKIHGLEARVCRQPINTQYVVA